MTTTRLGATELAPGQADPDVTVNEALAYAMTMANHAICVQVSLDTPPGSPAEYDTYVCGASPTGAWSGKAKNIAFYYNSTWFFIAPLEGMEAYAQDSNDKYVYDGSAWTVSIPSGGGAPSTADYLVKTANGSLSAERVVTDTATLTWDWATAGQAKGNVVLDTDGTLAANSDTKIASQKAVKTYVDAAITAIRNGVSGAFDTLAEIATELALKAYASLTLTAGAGLTGGGDLSANRTFTVGAGTGIAVNADDVAIDKASNANMRAAVADKVVTADRIETASAFVALTDAATVALDWDAGINFTLTIGGNRTLGNATNGQPGTWRTIIVTQDGTGNRTLLYDTQYQFPGGTEPVITTTATTGTTVLSILCVTTSLFYVFGALDMKV